MDAINQLLDQAKELWDQVFGAKSPPNEPKPRPKKNPTQSKHGVGDELAKKGILSGNEVNSSLADQFGMQKFSDLTGMQASLGYYEKIPYSFVKKHCLIPIKEEGDTLLVAVADPLDLDPIEELQLILKQNITAVYAPREQILRAISHCYDTKSGAASELIQDLGKQRLRDDETGMEVYDLLEDSPGQSPIVKLLNLILTEAIQQGASDIHFEPFEDSLRVRYRIDGVLHTKHSPAQEYQSQLLTRVKVMAKLDIAERRLPQDGRIKLRMGQREIDFRVSTIPVTGGERIVLRILAQENVALGLTEINMPPKILKEFERMISFPEGIILVTGPTGSGKTTTLYSSVSDIYNEETNIMTIEDPVEYNLKGIAQIGVRPDIGLTFASGLRTILRQDPDIVMVGEIRDKDTAIIAIQASLTGHLVLSTLHTNDAPSAITRLVDMGIEPYLISSSVIGVLAQRLVRKICPHCKVDYQPTPEELKEVGLDPNRLKGKPLFYGKGCAVCFDTGYKGRHGIYELLTINDQIRKQIVKSPDATVLRELALESGMSTLIESAAEVVLKGETTVSEALRVVRSAEE